MRVTVRLPLTPPPTLVEEPQRRFCEECGGSGRLFVEMRVGTGGVGYAVRHACPACRGRGILEAAPR